VGLAEPRNATRCNDAIGLRQHRPAHRASRLARQLLVAEKRRRSLVGPSHRRAGGRVGGQVAEDSAGSAGREKQNIAISWGLDGGGAERAGRQIKDAQHSRWAKKA